MLWALGHVCSTERGLAMVRGGGRAAASRDGGLTQSGHAILLIEWLLTAASCAGQVLRASPSVITWVVHLGEAHDNLSYRYVRPRLAGRPAAVLGGNDDGSKLCVVCGGTQGDVLLHPGAGGQVPGRQGRAQEGRVRRQSTSMLFFIQTDDGSASPASLTCFWET